jgi:hypothetical protein
MQRGMAGLGQGAPPSLSMPRPVRCPPTPQAPDSRLQAPDSHAALAPVLGSTQFQAPSRQHGGAHSMAAGWFPTASAALTHVAWRRCLGCTFDADPTYTTTIPLVAALIGSPRTSTPYLPIHVPSQVRRYRNALHVRHVQLHDSHARCAAGKGKPLTSGPSARPST